MSAQAPTIQEILRLAMDGVRELIDRFAARPFHYPYEIDLQCELHQILRHKINYEVTDAEGRRHCLVYAEGRGQTSDWIDIVCLDPVARRAKSAEQYAFGIEIKLVPFDDRKWGPSLYEPDVKKLRAVPTDGFKWLQISFFQNPETFQNFCRQWAPPKNDRAGLVWNSVVLAAPDPAGGARVWVGEVS